MIILLNGVSSSGKTSISTALAKLAIHDCRVLSFDEHYLGFLAMCKAAYSDIPQDEESQSRFGSLLLDDLTFLFHSLALGYSQSGRLVIMDTVLHQGRWKQDFLKKTEREDKLFVGLYCSNEELQRREQLRGDREVGIWSQQIQSVHVGIQYDLELDTTNTDPDTCARRILAEIHQSP